MRQTDRIGEQMIPWWIRGRWSRHMLIDAERAARLVEGTEYRQGQTGEEKKT
jgi:hypothetical protein